MTKNKDIIQQGKDGETAFQDWMDAEEIGYLRIDQNIDSLSSIFQDAVKRPDFLLLIPSIGFIAVDVKHYTLTKNAKFTLNIPNEIVKSATFEHHTKIYLWYAYKDKACDGNKWYFISAHKALEIGERKTNNKSKEEYLSIDLKHYEVIQKAGDISKLFSARIGALGRFTRAIEHGLKSIKL